MTDAFFLFDESERITYTNRQFEQLLGLPRERVLGREVNEVFAPEPVARFLTACRRAVAAQTPVTIESHYESRGEWFELRIFPTARGVAVYMRDITSLHAERAERERLEASERAAREIAERATRALRYHTAHDPLTGLVNGRELARRLAMHLERPGATAVVLHIDLDRFTRINDTLGRAAGDQMLLLAARRLMQIAGPHDLVARPGADEFVVGLLDADERVGEHVAQAILEAARQPPGPDGKRFAGTLSVGMAFARSGGDVAAVLREADTALHRAKEEGRDRAVWFDPAVHEAIVRRVELEQALRGALGAEDQLQLHYQPQFSLADGAVVGVEGLLRWQHPALGPVPPARSIPVAEESGLIDDLGAWVIRTAAAQAQAWAAVPGLVTWVNVSPRQLSRPGLADYLHEVLTAASVPADRFGVEVTESSLADFGRLRAELDAVSDLGIRLAVDDFGTGYSSLARLTSIPVDVLKIDRSFVNALGSPTGDAVLNAIVVLAHAVGASVIAEGVERPEQLDQLRALGCDVASGYHLARPAPPAEISFQA